MSVIFPQSGESIGPKVVFCEFVTQSTFAKSDNFFSFFTGFKHAAVATIPLVLNLLCDLFAVFFDFVDDCIISVLERTIAFVLTLLVLGVKVLSGDSDVERLSAGNLNVEISGRIKRTTTSFALDC